LAQRIHVLNGSDSKVDPLQGQVDPAQVRAQIRREIEQELKENTLSQQLSDAQDELKEMRTPANKLSYLIEECLNRWNATRQPAAMQGFEVAPDPKALEAAFSIFLDKLGEDTILQVAQRLESDPGLALQIKTFMT
jgi:FKBP-type peptidyl-prolyl cis-trans isomerase (trigger factor)